MPLVRQVSGKTFSNVTICMFKLRNFESKYRGNATKRLRGCIICRPLYAIIVSFSIVVSEWVVSYIISLGVGWLALLILTWGQCEGLNIGIGAEESLPRLFFVSKILVLMLSWGVVGKGKNKRQ